MIAVVDTYPEFAKYLSKYVHRSVQDRMDGWLTYHMAGYPELRAKCIDDYSVQGIDWRQIAAECVFPLLSPENITRFETAHHNLLQAVHKLQSAFYRHFGLDRNIVAVIYCGLGNGAGWATDYCGCDAVLFGLENIVDLNWLEKDVLEGLFAHELCHIAHRWLRGEALAQEYADPAQQAVWQLYIEGFAQRYQQVLCGREYYHQDQDGWLDWCQRNQQRLKELYLERLENELPVTEFYGNWHSIEGYSDTGYYLGCEFVKFLEDYLSLQQIAVLTIDELSHYAAKFLKTK